MFFEGIRSERELVRVAADRLSVRWYLAYDLDEELPDHSSLTRIRKRYGLAVFRRFFGAPYHWGTASKEWLHPHRSCQACDSACGGPVSWGAHDASLRVTLQLHPDRQTRGGVPLLAALARDGVYRSQFET